MSRRKFTIVTTDGGSGISVREEGKVGGARQGVAMSDDGSEYVSNHDRGAFGKLLAEARELGAVSLEFFVGLNTDAENDERWSVSAGHPVGDRMAEAYGRTGEEALRRLVERLRIAREGKST